MNCGLWKICTYSICLALYPPHSISLQTLKTKEIGRLTIYAPVINSTMTLVSNLNMRHGLAVIGRKQTAGVGRNKNQVIIRYMIKKIQLITCLQKQYILNKPIYSVFSVAKSGWLCIIFSTVTHSIIKSIGSKIAVITALGIDCHSSIDYETRRI